MKIQIKKIRETDFPCDAVILPVMEGDPGHYDRLGHGIPQLIKKTFSREFKGRQNQVFLIRSPENIKPESILLIGMGSKKDIDDERIRQAGGKAAQHLRDSGIKNAALSTPLFASLKRSPAVFIEGALLGLYTFDAYKRNNNHKGKIDSITILSGISAGLMESINRIKTVSASVNFTRDLVNTPSNDMTPAILAREAISLRRKDLSVKVIDKKDAERLGMGAFLSVSKGSHEPPKFIVLEYNGSKNRGPKKKPLVLIGKSITFDSGGISIKPSEGMEKMKYDMAGGAAVLGIFRAVSELKLPVHLVGILPATENLPGGSATRPGDVVKAIDGKTIEIINTDAEGRLVIADAIGFAGRFRPQAIIDIATLTGACSIALGNEAIAMMGNDRGIIEKIKRSSARTYERVWEMPLFDEYRDYLKSDIADIKNTGGKTGSLVTAAYFLKEFAGHTPWLHLDIAGTAWEEKGRPYIPKGASGIGVRLIMDMLSQF